MADPAKVAACQSLPARMITLPRGHQGETKPARGSALPAVIAMGLFFVFFLLIDLGGLICIPIVRFFRGPPPALAPSEGESGHGLAGAEKPGWTRAGFLEKAGALLWPFSPRTSVRLAFPCPACHQPLLGRVAPNEELICPWCGTTFQTPAPPPAAPPVPRKVMNQTKTKGGFSFVGFVKGLSAICGFGFIICCLVNMLLGLGFQAGIILVCGLGTGWVLQALQRRFWLKGPFLAKPFFAEGGGSALRDEIMRTVRMVGLPFAIGGMLWAVIACLVFVVWPLLLWTYQ